MTSEEKEFLRQRILQMLAGEMRASEIARQLGITRQLVAKVQEDEAHRRLGGARPASPILDPRLPI